MSDVRVNFITSGQEVLTGALRQIGGGFVDLAANAISGAASAFADFAQESFAGAIDAQRGIDELNASITRMGAASPITAEASMAMADAYKNLVGGSDDVVLAMENVGLRFNQIGADTFPRFIQSSADMAAALKMDPVKAAELLGKTLQDISVDGVGSIGKLKAAGVQLTDAQEKQILAMVQAGDAAAAQNLILDALATTTGGAAASQAETLAGQWAIFQETIADAGEGVALTLLPPLTKLAGEILPPVSALVSEVAEQFGYFFEALSSGDSEGALYALYEGFDILSSAFPGMSDAIETVRSVLFGLIGVVQSNFPIVQSTIQSVFAALAPVIASVVDLWETKLAPAFSKVFGDLTAGAPPAGDVFKSVMDGVVVAAQGMADFLVNVVIPGIAMLVDWFMANWPSIRDTGAAIMEGLQTSIQNVLDAIMSFWNEWGDDIMAAADAVWKWVTDTFATFKKAFDGDWRGFGEDLRTQWDSLWAAIQKIVTDGIDALLKVDWADIGNQIIQGVAGGISAATHFIVEAAQAAASAAFEAAKGFLGISSPSKLFKGIGENMMLGMANGILGTAGVPAAATVGAAYAAAFSIGQINVSGAQSPTATADAVEARLESIARDGFQRARLR